jgi:hypothetical protein
VDVLSVDVNLGAVHVDEQLDAGAVRLEDGLVKN